MPFGQVFGTEDSLECCEPKLLPVAIPFPTAYDSERSPFPTAYDSERSIVLHVRVRTRQLGLWDSHGWRNSPHHEIFLQQNGPRTTPDPPPCKGGIWPAER